MPDVQLTVGEIIVAVLSLRNPLKDGVDIKAEMDIYLSDKLAKCKKPRKYFIVDNIPRNHLGKVNKKTIVKDLQLKL